MYGEGNGSHGGDRRVGVSEHEPQPDPPGCEARVYRVPHVASPYFAIRGSSNSSFALLAFLEFG